MRIQQQPANHRWQADPRSLAPSSPASAASLVAALAAFLLFTSHTFGYLLAPLRGGHVVHAAQTPSIISPVFTSEVAAWSEDISVWAEQYELDPNLIATVIQIESCGHASITSPAGAQGLFQVMPFHFTAGENMIDVATNAKRGLDYLASSLDRANGHVGLALAGYNGGISVIDRTWSAWAAETRRYYTWGYQIYAEASAGMTISRTVQAWLAACVASLCELAATQHN